MISPLTVPRAHLRFQKWRLERAVRRLGRQRERLVWKLPEETAKELADGVRRMEAFGRVYARDMGRVAKGLSPELTPLGSAQMAEVTQKELQ